MDERRPPAPSRNPGATGWWPPLAILLAAFAIRAWDFGDPVLGLDEQWYLLVGDRVLHGAVPFVDIWDRKPAGLFLLYAPFAMLGDGIVAYQVAATLAAGGTAVAIHAIVRQLLVPQAPAIVAALVYLLAIGVLGGRGGQAPVFYNLPIAAAVLVTLRLPRLMRGRPEGLWWNGAIACALAGLTIQLKYSTIPECAFIGVAHVVAARRAGIGAGRIARWTAGWIAIGSAPTLAAMGFYAALGSRAFADFWFANFVSITLRQPYPRGEVALRLAGILLQALPLILPAALTAIRWLRAADRSPAWLIVGGWTAAAVLGFVAIGTFHDHYALPLLVPLACMAGPAFARHRWLAIASLIAALSIYTVERLRMPDDSAAVRRVAALMRQVDGDRCPYVAMGDPILYHLADACLPTAYAFPNTLAQSIEQGSTGIDEAGEVARILARRPPVIVMSDRRRTKWNAATLAVIRTALARDYRLVAREPRANYHHLIYLRRGDRAVLAAPAAIPYRSGP